jgi:hypothetical protein
MRAGYFKWDAEEGTTRKMRKEMVAASAFS